MNDIKALKKVFYEVFDRDFDFNFDDRMSMQKTIYLLNELGVSCGDYNFIWYKRGPYSQALQNDMFCINSTVDISKVRLTHIASELIGTLKKLINDYYYSYDTPEWLETLASLHYLHAHVHPMMNENQLLLALKNAKPHLSSDEDNKRAYDLLKDLKMIR